MDLAGRTRNTAATAALAGLAGFTVTLHGAYRNQPAHSLAGVCITMISLTALILIAIHKWTTDTSTERIALGAAQREAQAEQARYFALQASQEVEMGRLRQDINAERARIAEQLRVERQAMEDEFAQERGELSADAMNILTTWIVQGKVSPPERQTGNLIRFPNPEKPEPGRQRERAREHGVVGP